MTRNQFWLSDEQWARIEPHLPTDVRGKARVDDRRVISGIVHVLRIGCRWEDLPPEYGPHTTIYNRFVRWAERGVWENLFIGVAARGRSTHTQMIDSTHVKAHRSASGGEGDRLGYTNPSKAMADHCNGIAKRYPIADALGRLQETGRTGRASPHRRKQPSAGAAFRTVVIRGSAADRSQDRLVYSRPVGRNERCLAVRIVRGATHCHRGQTGNRVVIARCRTPFAAHKVITLC
jgi:transposase